jgi:hypothetical protein
LNILLKLKTFLGLITWQTSVILLVLGLLIVSGILTVSQGIEKEVIQQVDETFEIKYYDQKEKVFLSEYKDGTEINVRSLLSEDGFKRVDYMILGEQEEPYFELYPGYYEIKAEYEGALVGIETILVVPTNDSVFMIDYADIVCEECEEECKTLSCLNNNELLVVALPKENILFPISSPLDGFLNTEIRKVWTTDDQLGTKSEFVLGESIHFFIYLENNSDIDSRSFDLNWKVNDSDGKLVYQNKQPVSSVRSNTGVYAVHVPPPTTFLNGKEYNLIIEISPGSIKRETKFQIGKIEPVKLPDIHLSILNIRKPGDDQSIISIGPNEEFDIFVEFILINSKSLDSLDIKYVITDSDNHRVADKVDMIKNIAPNQLHRLTIKDFISDSLYSSYRIEVVLDPLNRIQETNKSNNRLDLFLPITDTTQYDNVKRIRPQIYETSKNNFLIY